MLSLPCVSGNHGDTPSPALIKNLILGSGCVHLFSSFHLPFVGIWGWLALTRDQEVEADWLLDYSDLRSKSKRSAVVMETHWPRFRGACCGARAFTRACLIAGSNLNCFNRGEDMQEVKSA